MSFLKPKHKIELKEHKSSKSYKKDVEKLLKPKKEGKVKL